jgi:hypothetical protein
MGRNLDTDEGQDPIWSEVVTSSWEGTRSSAHPRLMARGGDSLHCPFARSCLCSLKSLFKFELAGQTSVAQHRHGTTAVSPMANQCLELWQTRKAR